MIDLERCPWCACTTVMIAAAYAPSGPPFWAECVSARCGARGPKRVTQEAAAAIWNRIAVPVAQLEKVVGWTA